MLETFAKKAGIPVEETILASQDGSKQGVLVREALPAFSIHTEMGLRIDVPPILFSELMEADQKSEEKSERVRREENKKGFFSNYFNRDDLFNVFDRHIRSVRNCPANLDLSFLKKSLFLFYDEYLRLRENDANLASFVRAATNEGITFNFYEKDIQDDGEEKSSCEWTAEYDPNKKAINFDCSNYLDDGSDHFFYHSSFAHELSHYIVDDDNGFSTFLRSDFGLCWLEQIKEIAFLGNRRWERAKATYQRQNKKLVYGDDIFFENLAEEYDIVLRSPSYDFDEYKKEELFVRMCGIFANNQNEENRFTKKGSIHAGLELVCMLADAKANNDTKAREVILKELESYKVSSELKNEIIAIKSRREDIVEKRTSSLKEYTDFLSLMMQVDKIFMTEYRKIKRRIATRVRSSQKEENTDKRVIINNADASILYASLAKASRLMNNSRADFHIEADKKNPEKKELYFYHPLKNPPAIRYENINKLVKKTFGVKERE